MIKDNTDPRWLTDDAEERRRAVQAERDRKARERNDRGNAVGTGNCYERGALCAYVYGGDNGDTNGARVEE